jgi:hypothetical protein
LRAPCALLARSCFEKKLVLGDHSVLYAEPCQKNLGKGRGRVRRIHLLMPDGDQVTILATSRAPAEEVIRAMVARWARQENQFKHQVERWGINQLDGRSVEPYPAKTIIPNPARRRLDRALKIARAREAECLRKLSQMSEEDPKRAKLELDRERALRQQEELEAVRPSVPKHATLETLGLDGELVHHRGRYKLLLDTVRILLANVESALAAQLAPHLCRAAEAKKTLANLLAAPGSVRLGRDEITITLHPAGTCREWRAFGILAAELNEASLTLPGDPSRRRLRIRVQQHVRGRL